MCCININFTVSPFTFNTDCICKLLYMIVTHYQNKALVQQGVFGTILNVLLMPFKYTQNPSKV